MCSKHILRKRNYQNSASTSVKVRLWWFFLTWFTCECVVYKGDNRTRKSSDSDVIVILFTAVRKSLSGDSLTQHKVSRIDGYRLPKIENFYRVTLC